MSLVQYKTVPAMSEVARILAEMRQQVNAYEDGLKTLDGGKEGAIKIALMDVVDSSLTAAEKADKVIRRLRLIQHDLQDYLDNEG